MNHTTVLPTEKETYTNFNGEIIEVECFEWLEDGRYYDDETEEELPCSRYCIGVGDDGDGISVWLNDDMVEVDA